MTSLEIVGLFAKNYQTWLKLSSKTGFFYEKQLTAKQTKWFFDTHNREKNFPAYETQVSGDLEIDSKPVFFRLTRIRDGDGILTITPKEQESPKTKEN